MIFFIQLLFPISFAYSKNIEISKTTLNSVNTVFSSRNIQYSDRINIKLVKNTIPTKSGELVIEGANVNVQFGYRGNVKNTQLIGVFLDGNKEPLVATISPNKSLSKDPFYFSLRGVAENDCYGKFMVLIVIKEKNILLANSLPFTTFVADCAGQ